MAVAKASTLATEEQSTCSVCLEGFQEPKVLPCCHSFCLKCLKRILEKAKGKREIICPKCKASHQVPQNGAQDFLTDYTLATVSKDQHKTSSSPTCQQCSEGREAVTYCLTCSHLCQDCLEAHKRLKIYSNHEIATNQTVVGRGQPKREYYCKTHPGTSLTLYCETCRCLACFHCLVATHNGHDIRYINDTIRKKIEETTIFYKRRVHTKLKEFEQSLHYVTAVENTAIKRSTSLKAEINKFIDSIIANVETKRTALLGRVDSLVKKDLKELWAQKEYHESSMLKMKSALRFTERSLECRENTEVLALCTQAVTRLNELSQLKWESKSTELVEISSTLWEPQKDTQNIEVGKVKRSACPPVLQIVSKDMPESVQSDKIVYSVTAAFRPSPITAHSGMAGITLTATLGSGAGTVSVERKGESLWRVMCKPDREKKHVSIILTAKGTYGGETVSKTVKHTILVHRH